MLLDRKTAPKIHDAITFDFSLPAIHQEELENGTPFYWINAGVQDVVEIDWVFPAGMWQETKEGIANATLGLIKSGTKTRTAHEINEAFEFYGAAFKVKAGNNSSTISLFTLTKHLPALLPLVYEIFTESIFPQEEVDLYKQNIVQRLMVNLRQCDFVANQKIDAELFGEHHPYGRYSKRENIEALTQADIQSFFQQQYDLGSVKIFMGGNIGTNETMLVNNIFGKHKVEKTAATDKEFAIEEATEKKNHIINDPNGVQGAIRIARFAPNRHHKDFAPLVVLNTIFGGYFGSRLMSNIREEKGYTYGIYSGMAPMRYQGTLTIQTEVGRDVIEPAITEIYKEMDLLCKEQVDEEELLLVKNYLLGNLLGDLDGPFHILQRWRTLILNGLPVEHFDENIAIYKSVTAQELHELAQQYFNKEDFHEIVVI